MRQKLFFVCGFVGLLIGGALSLFGDHVALSIVASSIMVSAIVILFIGRWHKKHGRLK